MGWYRKRRRPMPAELNTEITGTTNGISRDSMKEAHRTGYMDKVDFDHELAAAIGGNRVYASEEDLRVCQPCTKECGVVQVDVVLRKVIQESDFSESIKRGKPLKDWTEEEKEASRKRILLHRMTVAASALAAFSEEERQEILEMAKTLPHPFKRSGSN